MVAVANADSKPALPDYQSHKVTKRDEEREKREGEREKRENGEKKRRGERGGRG